MKVRFKLSSCVRSGGEQATATTLQLPESKRNGGLGDKERVALGRETEKEGGVLPAFLDMALGAFGGARREGVPGGLEYANLR